VTNPTASFTAHPFARPAGRSLLIAAAAAVLLLGIGAHLSTAPAATAVQATAQASLTASSPQLASSDSSYATGCWVSGDLVGEGNPADLAAAFCGRK
jgi:hypothetical protein